MRPLFEQFPGLATYEHYTTNIKLEFQTTEQSQQCMSELQGFNVDGVSKLKIKYGLAN